MKVILIIFCLLDGKKYNQTQIKDRINYIMKHPIQFMKVSVIGWNNELEEGMRIAGGRIDDSSVSRIVKDLEKKGIVEKKIVQIGGGAASACIQLKEDINALMYILSEFNSPHFSDLSFLWLGTQLIHSNYGKKLINEELIQSYNQKNRNSFTNVEEKKILELINLSPSALKSFIVEYIIPQVPSQWEKYQLFSHLVLSLLNDFRVIGFQHLPVAAEVSLIFNKDNLTSGKKCEVKLPTGITYIIEYLYKVNEERIDLTLY